MGTDQIMYCIVALILGMLLANMLKNVCGCKSVVEGMNKCKCNYKTWTSSLLHCNRCCNMQTEITSDFDAVSCRKLCEEGQFEGAINFANCGPNSS